MSEAGEAAAGDPREELAELVASTRALIEWYEAAGASEVLVDATPESLLAALGSGAVGARAAPRGPTPPAFASPPAHRDAAYGRPAVAAPQPGSGAPLPGIAAPQPSIATPQPSIAAPQPSSAAPLAAARAPIPAAAAAFASSAMPSAMPSARAVVPPPGALQPGGAAAGAPTASSLVARAAPSSIARVTASDDRRSHLAVLADEARACTRCALHERRKQAVFARGNPFAELVFVGEGPGADEDDQGEPFVGKAGQLLDKMIVAMGYATSDVYICNIVKCRPPENRKPEPEEMAACSPFVTQQLALIKPKVIVALGATAVQGLVNSSEGITRQRGKWKVYKQTIPVMPTFHPAYLLRTPAAKRDVWNDLKLVMERLGKPLRSG